MFLPFESSLTFWLSQSVYGWEPVPPAIDPANDAGCAALPVDLANAAAADGLVSSAPMGLPAMRLVFKGVKWTACPVFGLRENVAWDQVSQTHRSVDEEQRDDAQREARKTHPHPPEGKGD